MDPSRSRGPRRARWAAVEQRHGHDEVPRVLLGRALVLHDREHAVPGRIELHVREAQGRVVDERARRRLSRAGHDEPVAGELREDDDAVPHRVGAATVLVDARADVEVLRHGLLRGAVGSQAHERDPSALVGP